MTSITTKLTNLLKIKAPVVLPPLGNVFHPNLISTLTRSGAFGFVGAGALSPDDLRTQLQTIRATLNINATDHLPVGVGFLTWILEKDPTFPDPRVAAVLQEKVQAVWFAFGDNNGKYIEQVRSVAPQTQIFVIVSSVEEALKATNEWHADVLVVQGIEAGGHGAIQSVPLSVLLSAVIKALPEPRPVILAAGGIATGSQVASVLTLGADGAAMGTRFLATHESGYSQARKDVLVEAKLASTARSRAFDDVNRTPGWPEGTDGRAIANEIIEDEKKGLDLPTRLSNADKSKNDMSRTVTWAGAGVGLIGGVQSAEEVLDEVMTEAIGSLKRASALLGN